MKQLRVSEVLLKTLIYFFAGITMGILIWILWYIIYNGMSQLNWEFVSTIYRPVSELYGVYPMILNTVFIVGLTLCISTPVGICSAIYLAEYSKPGRILSTIRFATDTLAGIPSIVYGIFGYIFFGIVLGFRFSLLSGALTLSIMVLPTLIRASEEAIMAIPGSYKEGSLALGATRFRTIMKVVLPCATPGILSAVILSIGRIVGETAALMLTAGFALNVAKSVMNSGRTLSVHLYHLAQEAVSQQQIAQSFSTAAILVLVVAFLNLVSRQIAMGLKRISGSGQTE